MDQRRFAVRDDQRRRPARQRADAAKKLAFRSQIDRRRRFIKQQQGGTAKEGTGNHQPLALPAR